MTVTFKDHFSAGSNGYRQYRPTYPAELFAWLSSLTHGRHAWDCATGSGQAAYGLAAYFTRVFATDASIAQLKHAILRDNIEYLLCLAECSCFSSSSIDLITVSQSMHWFDFDAFFREAERVLCENGVLAFWGYGLGRITPEIDAVVDYFYNSVIGAFWPPERRYIEAGYRNIALPMEEMEAPDFAMEERWNMDDFLGYLATWSAVRRYEREKKADPLSIIRKDLLAAWEKPDRKRKIIWPLFMRVGRKSS